MLESGPDLSPRNSPISGPRASGATVDRQPPAPDRRAEPAAPGLPGAGHRRRLIGGRADVIACLLLAGCSLLLFRLSLFQGWTFIGDPDRLNNIMNLRLFEVISILKRGSVPAWSEHEFMGYGVSGVHWMLPGAPPLAGILALLPLSGFYYALAILAAAQLAAAMIAAYWALGAYTSGPVQRIVGALLYGTGAYTFHKLMQLDLSYAALIAPPLLHRLVFSTTRDRAPWTFLGMAACWAFLVVFTVLQEIAYIGLFWGLYALFRSVRLRDPWPLVAAGLAFAVGVLIGTPRILTIATELSVLDRTSTNIQTTAIEAVRYFGNGLLGRSRDEYGILRSPPLNLHEGVQLLGSGLAALAVIAFGLLAPSRWLRFWSIALVAVLSVALNAYFRNFYDLDALGLRNLAYPSRELRTVVVNALLLGVPLWLLGWWATRRSAPPSRTGDDVGAADIRAAQRSGVGDSPRTGPVEGGHARTEPAAAQDLPFLFGFVVLALAVILIPEARLLFYYGFMKMDFLHSRISVAMTLPLAIIAALFLDRFLPAHLSRTTGRWLAMGLGLGLVVWVLREAAGLVAIDQFGAAVEPLRPRRLLTLEAVRVLSSLLVLLVALVFLLRSARPRSVTIAGAFLAAWMALETITLAEYRLNGQPAVTQARPFANLDYMQVPPGQMRVPSLAERAVLGSRLETDQYRSVVIEDRDTFQSYADSHLAAFWDLRLVEGYSTGSPRRLGLLPWSEDIYAPHQTGIYDSLPIQDLPWQLLAALNVKYVVVVDQSLWYNPSPGGQIPPFDVARLAVHENPYPVTPRAFFAARVTAAGQAPRLAGDDGKRPAPKDPPIEPPAQHSVVEGFSGERRFATDGAVTATFDGDRVQVRFDPATEDRFLVLNEMYHPSWRAWVDGAETIVYPTNVVMRGILVPAGATSVELTFVPFVYSPLGYAVMALGILLVGLLVWGLRAIDLTSRAPFLTRRAAPSQPPAPLPTS